MALNKKSNEYAKAVAAIYEEIPKAVFAAIAVSVLTSGGDHIEDANRLVLAEWDALNRAGIVPQKVPVKWTDRSSN